MILDRKAILSDLWYTEPAIFQICDKAGGNKGVFDPTTDAHAIALQATHGTKVEGFTEQDNFLLLPDDVEIPKLGEVSLLNSPYSVKSGGAKPYIDKHLKMCNDNDLFALIIINAAIGARWFHQTLQSIALRDHRVGLVEGRLKFWGQMVEWKKDGVEQKPSFIASLQPYLKDHDVEIVRTIGIEQSSSPRYDNVLLYVAPKDYGVWDIELMAEFENAHYNKTFDHRVRWLQS
jgi:hypothetical protein